MIHPDTGLLRGTLDVLVLKALSWGPRHGYAVAEWIKAITDDEVLVEEGPLYTALHRLELKGWLTAEWGYSDNNRKAKILRAESQRPAGAAQGALDLRPVRARDGQGAASRLGAQRQGSGSFAITKVSRNSRAHGDASSFPEASG